MEKNLTPGSVNGDVLSRRLKDSANLSRAARAELRMKTVVLRWYEDVIEALKKTPALIGAAGRAIKIGADVAQPLADWRNKFEKDVIDLTIKKIDELVPARKL